MTNAKIGAQYEENRMAFNQLQMYLPVARYRKWLTCPPTNQSLSTAERYTFTLENVHLIRSISPQAIFCCSANETGFSGRVEHREWSSLLFRNVKLDQHPFRIYYEKKREKKAKTLIKMERNGEPILRRNFLNLFL